MWSIWQMWYSWQVWRILADVTHFTDCTGCHDTMLPVKLGAQEWRFLSRCHNQNTSGPPESRNRWLHIKYRAFKCLPPLIWAGGVLQSFPGSFIMWLPCSTIDRLGLSTSEHKLTKIICLLTSCCDLCSCCLISSSCLLSFFFFLALVSS